MRVKTTRISEMLDGRQKRVSATSRIHGYTKGDAQAPYQTDLFYGLWIDSVPYNDESKNLGDFEKFYSDTLNYILSGATEEIRISDDGNHKRYIRREIMSED